MLNTSCRDIILYHKGTLDYDTIGELIASLKGKMRSHHARFGLYKKLLTLMIESLENIIRYNSSIPSHGKLLKKYPPEFLICSEREYYSIETANIIYNSDIPILKEKIEMLKNMEQEEIKELYKTTITNGKFSDKGGAGLGIIEMAKVADDRIDGNFSSINDDFSYFMLRLKIKQPVIDT